MKVITWHHILEHHGMNNFLIASLDPKYFTGKCCMQHLLDFIENYDLLKVSVN